MSDVVPRRGEGAFQWNAGAWFGAQVGSTLWLLLLGGTFLLRGIGGGAVALAAFVVSNVVGTSLWARRDRLAPHPALQWLVATMFVTAAATFVAFDLAGAMGTVDERFSRAPRALYLLLAIYPALSAMFFLQERASRRRTPA